MDASFRSSEDKNPFVEKAWKSSEVNALEMKSFSHPTERIMQVTDPVLRKKMEKTKAQLTKDHPALTLLIKHSESLEENFFRLMDIIHLMAKMKGNDQIAQGQSDQERFYCECKNLIKMNQNKELSLTELWMSIIQNKLDPSDYRTALDAADVCKDAILRKDILWGIMHSLENYEDFDAVIEVAKRFPQKYMLLLVGDQSIELLLKHKNYDKTAQLAECLPEPTRSAMYVRIAQDVILNGSFKEALKYLDSIDFNHVFLNQITSYLVPEKDSLNVVFYIAEKKNSAAKEVFLKEIATFLGRQRGQYVEMIEVYHAIKPGAARDLWLQTQIDTLGQKEKIEPWVLIGLVELISDPIAKQEVGDALKKLYPLEKLK